MIWLPQPYPDEVIGSVLARGARLLGLSWARTLHLTSGRSPSSAPFLMPFALDRLAHHMGIEPEVLLERHTLFPYAAGFMPLKRREAFKARALSAGNDCRLDALAHVVLNRKPFRRVCPECIKEDLAIRGETYWRRSHLLPGVHICIWHRIALRRTTTPLQGGRDTSDSWLPDRSPLAVTRKPLPHPILESLAIHSVTALLRPPAERNWLERYAVASFALGYQLRSTAVASAVVAADLKRFFGDPFLRSLNADVDLSQKSPWPALLVRPQYPTRLAAPKHILMLSFLEHATPIRNLMHAQYLRPGPTIRDYKKVDLQAMRRMETFLRAQIKKKRRVTVFDLRRASGEQPCLKRFKERFPRSRKFLDEFRSSPYAARRVRTPVRTSV